MNSILSRVAAASFGGYFLTNVTAIFISYCLIFADNHSQANAALVGVLSSFMIFIVAILWVFSTDTAKKAWLGVIIPSVVLSVLNVLLAFYLKPTGLF